MHSNGTLPLPLPLPLDTPLDAAVAADTDARCAHSLREGHNIFVSKAEFPSGNIGPCSLRPLRWKKSR